MTKARFKGSGRAGLAATLATALALTSVAASPARAGSEQTVGAIAAASFFALLTAGIIASTASQNRYTPPPVTYKPPPGGGDPRWGSGPGRPGVDPRKALPAQCEFTVRHGKDRGTYYDARCLQREFSFWPYLPDRCEQRIDVHGGRDIRGYDATCLARYGYTEAKPGPRSAHR